MTNKEAAEILKLYKQRLDESCSNLLDKDKEAFDLAIKTLENDRPTGEWIIDGHHIRCNRCNKYICNTDREGDVIPDNFCPNCGAKMKEANNGNKL